MLSEEDREERERKKRELVKKGPTKSHPRTRSDDPKEVDVIIGMESCELISSHKFWFKHFHFPIQAIVDHEIVSHANTMRLKKKC
jgi:hypothetical protein